MYSNYNYYTCVIFLVINTVIIICVIMIANFYICLRDVIVTEG